MSDDINHPSWYTSHPSKVECIDITEHLMFNVGNAIKYLWRAGLKNSDAVSDLKKAEWYVQREIKRLNGGQKDKPEEHGAVDSPAEDRASKARGLGLFGYAKSSGG